MNFHLSLLIGTLLFLITLNTPIHSEGFVLDISVPRISKFQLIQFHKKIQHGDNLIGQFILENNTIDGFRLTFSSPTHGQLSPESNKDGVISIPYTIWLEKRTGSVSSGVIINETPDLTAGIPISILDCYGSQNGKTDIAYNIYLTIDDPDDLLLMAGYYKESIEIEYTDY